jgi:hypothetical protein
MNHGISPATGMSRRWKPAFTPCPRQAGHLLSFPFFPRLLSGLFRSAGTGVTLSEQAGTARIGHGSSLSGKIKKNQEESGSIK